MRALGDVDDLEVRRRRHPARRRQGRRHLRPAQPERSASRSRSAAAGCARSRANVGPVQRRAGARRDDHRASTCSGCSTSSRRSTAATTRASSPASRSAWAARWAAPRRPATASSSRSARRCRSWASTPRTTRASVQGFGNVAQYAIRLYQQLGGTVICVSCWDQADQTSYSFRKETGIDLDELAARSPTASAASTRRRRRSSATRCCPGDAWIEQDGRHPDPGRAREPDHAPTTSARIRTRVKLIAEGANGPTTPEADAVHPGARHLPDPRLPGQRRRRDLQLLRAGAEQHELLLGEGRGPRQARRAR